MHPSNSHNGKVILPAVLNRNAGMPNTGNAFEPAQRLFDAVPCIFTSHLMWSVFNNTNIESASIV